MADRVRIGELKPGPDGMSVQELELPEELVRLLGIREEPGWTGPFSRKQFPGAIPNGSRIRKVSGEPGDAHTLGARGTVLGSIQPLPHLPYFYFVEWDDSPRIACGVLGAKIGPA